MRKIKLHRRAMKYFRRMPRERQLQMVKVLEEIAALPDIVEHPNVIHMQGNPQGWFRLRVGGYRALLQPRDLPQDQILYVDYIGPRGDAYRARD
jgi:mRNA-degrading endonuclease RelE of RelBE toxin-antitoxin system